MTSTVASSAKGETFSMKTLEELRSLSNQFTIDIETDHIRQFSELLQKQLYVPSRLMSFERNRVGKSYHYQYNMMMYGRGHSTMRTPPVLEETPDDF